VAPRAGILARRRIARGCAGIGRGGRSDAVRGDEDAVRLLGPYFLSQPAAFAGPIATYARDYVRRCALAGREPDMALLGPITDKLQNEL
jgi:hypothetical protein